MIKKIALITGITGQDGAILRFSLEKVKVHGIRSRISVFNTQRINHLLENDDNEVDKITIMEI